MQPQQVALYKEPELKAKFYITQLIVPCEVHGEPRAVSFSFTCLGFN